jgi:hypothetical protein
MLGYTLYQRFKTNRLSTVGMRRLDTLAQCFLIVLLVFASALGLGSVNASLLRDYPAWMAFNQALWLVGIINLAGNWLRMRLVDASTRALVCCHYSTVFPLKHCSRQ